MGASVSTGESSSMTAEEMNEQGEKYYYGRGVEQDYTQAVYRYRKAAEQGKDSAGKALMRLGV